MSFTETETCWHLLITTYDGKVSILKNLDAPTARQVYQRLKPDSRPRTFVNKPSDVLSVSYGGRLVGPHETRTIDILGPEGSDLDPWRGVQPEVVDLGIQAFDPRA